MPTRLHVARQVQRLYAEALPPPSAGATPNSTEIVPVRVPNAEILTPSEYSVRYLASRRPTTASDIILDTITQEGLRTFKKSLRKGDYATASAAAIVSLVAEDMRKNRPGA